MSGRRRKQTEVYDREARYHHFTSRAIRMGLLPTREQRDRAALADIDATLRRLGVEWFHFQPTTQKRA